MYCVWLVFEAVFCYFFIIETKNRTLEETAALFDGDQATRALHAAAGQVDPVVAEKESGSFQENKS